MRNFSLFCLITNGINKIFVKLRLRCETLKSSQPEIDFLENSALTTYLGH